MNSIIIKSLLAAALLLPFAATATPIQGDIGITGSLLPTCSNGAESGCNMAVADGLNFLNDQALVVFATGDFDTVGGLVMGSLVAMTDFDFDPFGGVNPLWSAGGFSFALNTLVVVGQTSTLLELRGTGMISYSPCAGEGCAAAGSLDPTMGTWSFSTDTARGTSTFAWSSTTLAPEPGILVLMGLGLIGGLGARRLTRS